MEIKLLSQNIILIRITPHPAGIGSLQGMENDYIRGAHVHINHLLVVKSSM